MTKHATDVEGLLGQVRWVEGFARALVREDSEDVAQDAWLAAIQRPPAASSRPWFATVMRNLTRLRFRSASRRRAREHARAAGDDVPTPAELAHRMELQRRLANAVVALEEPQRSTVVLVFFEGLSPAEVARQQGIPATTVRSRLRAALVTLRARLDAEEDGDRARWQLALAPLAAPKLAPVVPVAIAVVAATVVAAGVVIAIAVRRPPPPATADRSPDVARWVEPVAAVTPRPPAPALLPPSRAIVADTLAPVPSAFWHAERALVQHVDECYAIANRVGRDLKGLVQLSISLDPLGIGADVEVDSQRTTITDPDFLECIRENAMAIEAELERMRDQGERLEGLRVDVAREMPPTADSAETVSLSADDAEPPACGEGTSVAGTAGVRQWCALPDGTKHGLEWQWREDGKVSVTASYDRGASTMETTASDD